MKKTFLLACVIISGYFSSACINTNEKNAAKLNGEPTSSTGVVPKGKDLKASQAFYENESKELLKKWKIGKSIEDYSDYGVCLIYLGRFDEAKKIYSEIEKMSPGLYATASNIGTLYELLGNNDSALYWITKAVAIDSKSHAGSEWIHVNILKTKLQGTNAATSKSLLGVDFGNEEIPKTNISPDNLLRLRNQLYYQLHERMTFIKSNDKIMSILLFELGNITALVSNTTDALRIYDLAKRYGYTTNLFEKRYSKFLSLQKGLNNEYTKGETNKAKAIAAVKQTYDDSLNKWFVIAGVASALFIGYFFFIRNKRKEPAHHLKHHCY